jgi:LAO/AO transport system kinase
VSELAAQILDGDRRALARGITLVESTRDDHQAEADELLTEVMARTGGATRVGISGAPGVGKSTLIEALGLYLIDNSHHVAVLAVDPSSPRGGGSILGDKTRMGELTRRNEAFVRPSPTAGTLGGVARRTREAMLLCEAAGFDIVLIETVGVGQSEVAVEAMVDCFLLLVAPGGGDELQGIKRGIMELADLVVVNKSDGDLEAIAGTTAADYANALHLVRPKTTAWEPQVVRCSALEARGIDDVWHGVEAHHNALKGAGELERRRADQSREWMWSELSASLLDRLRYDPAASAAAERLEAEVAAGKLPAPVAAEQVLRAFTDPGDRA